MKYIVILIVSSIFFVVIRASGFGKCPDLPHMSEFDASKFSGLWYEVERTFYIMEITTKCTQMNVSSTDRGNLDIVTSSINRWNKRKIFAYGTAIQLYNNSSSYRYKVNTKLPFSIARFLPGVGNYKIIYTDYTHFAIVWYCTNILFGHNDRLFVLGRERDITEKSRIEIYMLLKKLNFNPDRLIVSKNGDC